MAIRVLAQGGGVLRRHADRVAALLRQRRIVDHQNRAVPADQPVGLGEQFRFQRRRIPNAGGDEVVQLIVVAGCQARRHRLHALAIPRTDQTRDIERAHSPARLVAQTGQERLQPPLQFLSPIRSHVRHGRLRQCRPSTNHSKADSRILKMSPQPAFCQSSARRCGDAGPAWSPRAAHHRSTWLWAPR